MEILNGFSGAIKPVISPYSALLIASFAIADTIFLTILQKRENRRNDPPLDNTKMQVG